MNKMTGTKMMPPAGKYKSTMNEYDQKRPKKQVMTKVCK